MAEQEADPVQIQRVAVRLPSFWKDEPDVWFAQCEAVFENSGILLERTKFNYVIAALDNETLKVVRDLVIEPPALTPYTTFRHEVINRIGATQEKKLQLLLGDLHLGDRSPTQLLRQMTALSNGSLAEPALKSLWLQRLPPNAQAILKASSEPLNQLATLADRILEITLPQPIHSIKNEETVSILQSISELQTELKNLRQSQDNYGARARTRSTDRTSSYRSRSKSSNRKQLFNGKCYFHYRFGDKARKCYEPCKEKVNFIKPQ